MDWKMFNSKTKMSLKVAFGNLVFFLFWFVLKGGYKYGYEVKNLFYDHFMHLGISSTSAPFDELMFENIKQW